MENERFNKFTSLIFGIRRLIQKIKDEEMSEFGLKGTHVTCLFYAFDSNGTMTATDICEVSGEDKSAVSKAIHELERSGYIAYSSDKKNYRAAIKLTAKGQKIAERMCEKIAEFFEYGSIDMSDRQREKFYKCLELVNKNLQKICLKYEK